MIQEREHSLRLVRQHEHALLAGALAGAWRTDTGAALPVHTVLATALHDSVWQEEDEEPRFDPSTARPYDFVAIPPARKRDFVRAGVQKLAAVDGRVAALVEQHHRALAEGLAVDPASPLAWMRFFDNLSLLACLTPPGSLAASRPRWLSPTQRPPAGGDVSVVWRDESTLALDRFPAATALSFALPYRDLPTRRYADAYELRAAWGSAREQIWPLTITERVSGSIT